MTNNTSPGEIPGKTFKTMKTEKLRIVKAEIQVRKEVKEHNLIIDNYGNIYRLPFVSENGKKFRFLILKQFYHCGYIAIKAQGKILNLSHVLRLAKHVKYKKRIEIDIRKLPAHMHNLIVSEVKTNERKYVKS